MIIQHDVLIVGGGIAGCQAALEIAKTAPHLSIGLIAKTHPIRSHSVAAQGGIAASLQNVDPEDSWKAHAFDTVKGSDYLADQDAVAILAQEAPQAIIDLEHLGVLFSRLADGRVAQRAFGGHSHNRTCYAADKTGHAILHELVMNLMRHGVTVYDEWYVMRLIVDEAEAEKTARGVVMFRIRDGQLAVVQARAVMLATGGYGRVFNTTSNDYACTGDGLAMVALAGLPLQDMEFVQFHPTGLYPVGVLVSEAVRGEGAYLINHQGDRFMAHYAPSRMELAPRDITSRAIALEVRAGRGIHPNGSGGGPFVYLDLRHMGREKIMSRVPFCWEEAHRLLGVDAVESPIPVRPTAHYCMGGIPTTVDGEVIYNPSSQTVAGLFSAGETACVSVHGANRLGSNSLLECVVYGRRTGGAIARFLQSPKAPDPNASALDPTPYLQDARALLQGLLDQPGQYRLGEVRQQFQDCMSEHCGVFRTAETMQAGLVQLQRLKQKAAQIYLDDKSKLWNTELTEALELRNLLVVGEIILASALQRQESRGAHFREDFPQRDDPQYLHHSLAARGIARSVEDSKDLTIEAWGLATAVKVQPRPVALGLFEPKERKY